MSPVNKILLGAVAAVALAIVVAFVWLSLANAHLKTQLAEERTRGTACLMANDAFTARIAEQNKAVELMKTASAAREKKAHEAANEAQEKARLFFVAADKLRKMKMDGGGCKAADAILNAYLGGGK
jgi:hypothetical protein